jgi:hypothetical protein
MEMCRFKCSTDVHAYCAVTGSEKHKPGEQSRHGLCQPARSKGRRSKQSTGAHPCLESVWARRQRPTPRNQPTKTSLPPVKLKSKREIQNIGDSFGENRKKQHHSEFRSLQHFTLQPASQSRAIGSETSEWPRVI